MVVPAMSRLVRLLLILVIITTALAGSSQDNTKVKEAEVTYVSDIFCSPALLVGDEDKFCNGSSYSRIIQNISELTEKNNSTGNCKNFAVREGSEELRSLLSELYLGGVTYGAEGLCGEHSRLAKTAALDLELWALQMLDSSAKLPSGVLSGNINQLGDFDRCLEVQHRDITGQYCLAFLEVTASNKAGPHLRDILERVHSYHPWRSNVSDPGHRVPRYTSLNWAVCSPSSCSASQVEQGLTKALVPLSKVPELQVNVTVQQGMCYVRAPPGLDNSTKLVLGLFGTLFGIIFLATLIDIFASSDSSNQQSRPQRLLNAFSLLSSWRRFTSTQAPKDDIASLHGIRFLNAFALLLCHKSAALFFEPFVNRTLMAERLTQPWTVIGRTAIIYTDSFILLSGLLAAYSFLPEMDRNKGRINVMAKYKARFFRIVPNLAAVILFCTYVIQLMGSGPQWSVVVQHYSAMCKKHMWKNFLFIHNFFGFEEMCLTHTHQVGIDMQLYILSPFLVLALWRWPRAGFLGLLTIAGASTWVRYVVTLDKQLTSIVYFGIPVRRMFDTAKFSYILPHHRLTSYVTGILLGYYLRRYPEGPNFSKVQTVLGWILVFTCASLTWLTPIPATSRHFQYDPWKAAVYSAIYPITWCSFIGGMILLCHKNLGGNVGKFMRWRGFVIFTRLSYSFYLTQFPIYFYNVGTRRHAGFSTHFDLINLSESFVIVVSSILLTLMVDLPFQQFKKVLSEQKVPSVTDNAERKNNNKQQLKIKSFSVNDAEKKEMESELLDPQLIRRLHRVAST